MKGQCPRCKATLRDERFIGNSYYCQCGWFFHGVYVEEDRSWSVLAVPALIMLGAGAYLISQLGFEPKLESLQVVSHSMMKMIQSLLA